MGLYIYLSIYLFFRHYVLIQGDSECLYSNACSLRMEEPIDLSIRPLDAASQFTMISNLSSEDKSLHSCFLATSGSDVYLSIYPSNYSIFPLDIASKRTVILKDWDKSLASCLLLLQDPIDLSIYLSFLWKRRTNLR